MVHRDDVVTALYQALVTPAARGKILNVAGGPTWQTTGGQYVTEQYEVLGVPLEMANFRSPDQPGWVGWYDTEASQRLLAYQQHTYASYLDTLRREVERMLED
jgi:hypothetical protein